MVSVIIPVYNNEKYLPQLFNNILNQTYKEFEVIFVNDGSTDNSLALLEEFCKNNSKASCYSKENGIHAIRKIDEKENESYTNCIEYVQRGIISEIKESTSNLNVSIEYTVTIADELNILISEEDEKTINSIKDCELTYSETDEYYDIIDNVKSKKLTK